MRASPAGEVVLGLEAAEQGHGLAHPVHLSLDVREEGAALHGQQGVGEVPVGGVGGGQVAHLHPQPKLLPHHLATEQPPLQEQGQNIDEPSLKVMN